MLLGLIRNGLKKEGFLRAITDEELEDALLSGTMYGAFKKGELIGVSALELDNFPYDVRSEFGVPKTMIGEIMCMAVREEYRGKGVANKINNCLIKNAKNLGAKAVGVSVHPENFAAIQSLKALGSLEFIGFDNRSYNEPNIVYAFKI